jgi:hypothetical protein
VLPRIALFAQNGVSIILGITTDTLDCRGFLLVDGAVESRRAFYEGWRGTVGGDVGGLRISMRLDRRDFCHNTANAHRVDDGVGSVSWAQAIRNLDRMTPDAHTAKGEERSTARSDGSRNWQQDMASYPNWRERCARWLSSSSGPWRRVGPGAVKGGGDEKGSTVWIDEHDWMAVMGQWGLEYVESSPCTARLSSRVQRDEREGTAAP